MKTQIDRQHKAWLRLLAIGLIGFFLTPVAFAAVVYSNSFSVSAGVEWSDTTTTTVNGEDFLADGVHGSGAGTNTLTLSSLPAHDSVTVSFDLYIIESWDGNGQEGGGVDNWQLKADGTNVLFTNFANFTGANTQAYPNQVSPYGPGGAFAPRTGAFANGHLGYGTGDFGDATYRFSFTFPHSASNIVLDFTSLQNQTPGDEGWGLDNVVVSANSVAPAPIQTANPIPTLNWLGIAVLVMLLAGFAYYRSRKTAA
jgi:hypothetical protein